MGGHNHNHGTVKQNTTLIAMAVASSLAIVKVVVGVMAGSLAIIASAVDSVLDVFASFFNYIALRISDKPADETHSFGHGKFEALASFIQSLIILVTGFFILYSAWNKFSTSNYEPIPTYGIVVMVISLVVTALLTVYMRRKAKQEKSTILETDAMHYAIDLYTNAGILLALVIIKFTGWDFIDPIIAAIVGVYIIISALKLSFNVSKILLDNNVDEETYNKITSILQSFGAEFYKDVHDLRTRTSGSEVFIDMHMTMCSDLPLKQVHEIIDEIEKAIKNELPEADIIIHPEPCEHKTQREKDLCCNAQYIHKWLRDTKTT